MNKLSIQIPVIGEIKKLIPLPMLKKPVYDFDREHSWEIGDLVIR